MNIIRPILLTIMIGIILIVVMVFITKVFAATPNITVPSAPNYGFTLESTSTGAWVFATSSNPYVTQSNHGFIVGDAVRRSFGYFTKAKADSKNNAEFVGFVSSVTDSNHFRLATEGMLEGFTGLATGSIYYLSATTSGAISTSSPTCVDCVNKPVGIAASSTALQIIHSRGRVVTFGVGATTTLNIAYNPDDTTDLLDWYNPADYGWPATTTPRPIILWVHEGGFTGGTKDITTANEPFNNWLRLGYAVASVDYTKAPFQNLIGTSSPPMQLDVGRAIQFFKLHAKEYNIDPNRITCAGKSAGATLCMILAYGGDFASTTNTYIQKTYSTRPNAIIDYQGQTDWTCFAGTVTGVMFGSSTQATVGTIYKQEYSAVYLVGLTAGELPFYIPAVTVYQSGADGTCGSITDVHDPYFGTALRTALDAISAPGVNDGFFEDHGALLNGSTTIGFLNEVLPEPSAFDSISLTEPNLWTELQTFSGGLLANSSSSTIIKLNTTQATTTYISIGTLASTSKLFVGGAGSNATSSIMTFLTTGDATTTQFLVNGVPFRITNATAEADPTVIAGWFMERNATNCPIGCGIIAARSRGEYSNKTIVQDGDHVARFAGLGYDGTTYQQAQEITFQIDGTPGLADMPGRILFQTSPDGSATPVERLRIDNAGLISSTGNLLFNSATNTITNLVSINSTSTAATSTSHYVSNIARINRLETQSGIYQGTVIAGGKGIQGMSVECDLFLGFGDCRFGTPNNNTSLNIDENGVMWFSGNGGAGTAPTGYYNVTNNSFAFRACGGTFAAPCPDTSVQYGLYFDQAGSIGGAGYEFESSFGSTSPVFKVFVSKNSAGFWSKGTAEIGGSGAGALKIGNSGTGTTTIYSVASKAGVATGTPTYLWSVGGDFGASNGRFASTTGVATSSFSHSVLIGTTTASTEMFSLQGFQNYDLLRLYASTTGGTVLRVTQEGHILTSQQGAISLSLCGTSPAASSTATDVNGRVTAGTGTVTYCEINFAVAYPDVPECTIGSENVADFRYVASTTATKIKVGSATSFAGHTFVYHCLGH